MALCRTGTGSEDSKVSEPVPDVPAWVGRLRRERSRRGWSRPEMAREMRRAAARLRVDVLDAVQIADVFARLSDDGTSWSDLRHLRAIASYPAKAAQPEQVALFG